MKQEERWREGSLPAGVKHDVHEQGGHGGQCVWVEARHAKHVTRAGEGVNDGPWDWRERGNSPLASYCSQHTHHSLKPLLH